MAKSKIILELLSEDNSLENVLFRLKTILHGLEDKNMYQWINYEVKGYPDEVEVPQYRVIGLTPIISFFDGRNSYKRLPAPVFHLLKEELELVISHSERGGVGSLVDDKDIGIPYDPYITQKLGEGIDRKVCVTEAFGRLPANVFAQIKANVKDKVLDILLDLEKKFGNLDDYDVLLNLGEQEKEEAKSIIKNYIRMGDNNIIKGSSLGVEARDE